MTDENSSLLVEIIGWIGSAAILSAYALNSYQKIRSDSVIFLFLNLTGGLLLIAYSYYKDAMANAFLNIVWVIVAVFALAKLYHLRRVRNHRL